ncbi:MAG: PfkB family carbohydrate kinase [Oscillospiraceae bacterium]|nr:PfkB family carbohydrate kinase [Oscillospiraceae bacterium]
MSTFCVDYFPESDEAKVGGNALNVAVSCAKLNKSGGVGGSAAEQSACRQQTGEAEVFVMGNIGSDSFGTAIREKAAHHGINHEHLYTIEGETASNKVYLTADGDRYFKDDSWTNGVLRDFVISANDSTLINTVDAVATTINDSLIMQIANASPRLLSVDFMDGTPCEDWREYFPSIDLFFVSAKSADLPLYKTWSREFPHIVFVATLGADGSVAFKGGEEFRCGAVEVEKVVDTTGCGDSYQGAFIVKYLTSGDISSAMRAGAESAAVTLGFVGAV